MISEAWHEAGQALGTAHETLQRLQATPPNLGNFQEKFQELVRVLRCQQNAIELLRNAQEEL